MAEVVIFGAGSWGTALGVAAAREGREVVLWGRRADAAAEMQDTRENAEYLPGVTLPERLTITSDLDAAAAASDLWLFCTPSQASRGVAEALAGQAGPDTIAYSASKGIENGTLKTATEVLEETLGFTRDRLGVLYGPSHAEEVGHGVPTAIVAAGYDSRTAVRVQGAFMGPRLRVYMNHDVRGVEIGGSVKNVLAVAAGISDGLGGGDNTKAALITRGIAEIRRLGIALGARAETFAGLTGLGDLVVTCMSQHSRNRKLGEMLGQGLSLDDALSRMKMVAEGVRTTESTVGLARQYGVEMPLTQAVYSILFEGVPALDCLTALMNRAPRHEEWWPEEVAEMQVCAPAESAPAQA